MSTPLVKLTPPQLGKRLGVDPSKIIGWIRSGELKAIDVSNAGSSRPRYRIDPIDIELFEQRRQVIATPKVSRRRRRDPEIIQFF